MSPVTLRSAAALGALCLTMGAATASAAPVTKTVGPGESVRTSEDAAPSPATPVIGTITAREWAPPPGQNYPPCTPETPDNKPCGPPSSTFTIDVIDPAGMIVKSGLVSVGQAVSFSAATSGQYEISYKNQPSPASVSVEIDRSLIPTGWNSALNVEAIGWPITRALSIANGVNEEVTFTDLPDGDVRMTETSFIMTGPGTYMPIGFARPRFGVQAKTALAPREYDQPSEEKPMPLPRGRADAAKKGLPVVLVSNYLCTMTAKVTVTRAVATKLKLKGTTLGTASFEQKQCNRAVKRIPLIKPAANALKNAKGAVQVAVRVDATNAWNGETARNTQEIILK